MSKLRLINTLFFTGFLLLTMGCKRKPQDVGSTEEIVDTTKLSALAPEVSAHLAEKAIVADQLVFEVPSPDSRYIALGLDSTVRFGPGDEMWPDELPSNWYGVRNRNILFLYDPSADTLHKLAECEEVVNLYDRETSQPVQPERKDKLGAVMWSPDGKNLLLLRDRISDGVSDQDVLIFSLGEEEPGFLDLFGVWRQLMKTYPGTKGTRVEEIGWATEATIRIILSMRGMPSARHEFIFDAQNGKVLSAKKMNST